MNDYQRAGGGGRTTQRRRRRARPRGRRGRERGRGQAGGDVVTGPRATEADVVVAVGDRALATLAATGTSTPVLPVETGFDCRATASRPESSGCSPVQTRLVHARCSRSKPRAERSRAVFEVALTAAEPATMPAFSVAAATEGSDRLDYVARFRADGVAVATPAGSGGYARAAGGPVVVPGDRRRRGRSGRAVLDRPRPLGSAAVGHLRDGRARRRREGHRRRTLARDDPAGRRGHARPRRRSPDCRVRVSGPEPAETF